MFKFTRFKQLQNLIEQLGSIAADQGTYSTHSYMSLTGSYTRIKWKYKNLLFSTEYPNSHKDKNGRVVTFSVSLLRDRIDSPKVTPQACLRTNNLVVISGPRSDLFVLKFSPAYPI